MPKENNTNNNKTIDLSKKIQQREIYKSTNTAQSDKLKNKPPSTSTSNKKNNVIYYSSCKKRKKSKSFKSIFSNMKPNILIIIAIVTFLIYMISLQE